MQFFQVQKKSYWVVMLTVLLCSSCATHQSKMPNSRFTTALEIKRSLDNTITITTNNAIKSAVSTQNKTEKLSGDSLVLLRDFSHDHYRFRLFVPKSAQAKVEALLNAFEAKEVEAGLHRTVWPHLVWFEALLKKYYRVTKVPMQIDAIGVPPDQSYERSYQISTQVPGFSMGIAANWPPDASNLDFFLNITNIPTTIFIHESVHFLKRYGEPYHYHPINHASDEAVAYTIATCAPILTGLQTKIFMNTGTPIEPDSVWQTLGVSSQEILDMAKVQSKGKFDSDLSTLQGSVLASLSLHEATGGRKKLKTDAERAQFQSYCEKVFTHQIDWLKTRPCQHEAFKGVCMSEAKADNRWYQEGESMQDSSKH